MHIYIYVVMYIYSNVCLMYLMKLIKSISVF